MTPQQLYGEYCAKVKAPNYVPSSVKYVWKPVSYETFLKNNAWCRENINK